MLVSEGDPYSNFLGGWDLFFFFRFHHQQLLSQVRFACFLGGPLLKFFLGWDLYFFIQISSSAVIISNICYFPRGTQLNFFSELGRIFFFRLHHQQLLSQVIFPCFPRGPLLNFFSRMGLYIFFQSSSSAIIISCNIFLFPRRTPAQFFSGLGLVFFCSEFVISNYCYLM